MFAPVYAALASRGINPREADDMEIWEVAAVFGLDEEDKSKPTTERVAGRVDPESFRLIKERMAHAAGLGPKPEVRATDPSALGIFR